MSQLEQPLHDPFVGEHNLSPQQTQHDFVSPLHERLYNLTHNLIFQGFLVAVMVTDLVFMVVGLFTHKLDVVSLACCAVYAIELSFRLSGEWKFYFDKRRPIKCAEIALVLIFFFLEGVQYFLELKLISSLRFVRILKFAAHLLIVKEARTQAKAAWAATKKYTEMAVAIVKGTLVEQPEKVSDPSPIAPPTPHQTDTVDDSKFEQDARRNEELLRKKREEEERLRKEQAELFARHRREREERLRREKEQREREEAEKRRKEEEAWQLEMERQRKEEALEEAERERERQQQHQQQQAAAAEAESLRREKARKEKEEEERRQRVQQGASLAKRIAEFNKLLEKDTIKAKIEQDLMDDEINNGEDAKQKKAKKEPSMPGKLIALFDSIECYRIDDTGNGRWGFFNATTKYDLMPEVTFGPDSEIRALGNTVLEPDESVRSGDGRPWLKCTVTVHPGCTEPFIEGSVNGYRSSFSAAGVSAAYRQQVATEKATAVQRRVKELKQTAVSGGGGGDDVARVERCVLQHCVSTGDGYIDISFPPLQQSLFRISIDRQSVDAIPFSRPSEYLPAGMPPCLFRNRIEPNDIDQGQLGDCWFLCSVASLAEFPEQVRELFRHPVPMKPGRELQKQERSVGAYRVTLNKHGWWHNVLLDDHVPAVAGPDFAHNTEEPDELWVALIEKAYAKLNGSYSAIVAGDALQALQDLTGFPTTRIVSDDWQADSLGVFTKLLEADRKGYLINLNTPGHDDRDYMGKHGGAANSEEFTKRYKKAGLGMGHAYTVLRVIETSSSSSSSPIRLVQIRNPWGNGTEWTGAWGDDDPQWKKHPDIARLCDFSPGPDGTFWMAWRDVQEYFEDGGICYLQPGLPDYRVQGGFVNGVPNVALEVRCPRSVTLTIVLSQKDRRGLAASDPGRKYEGLMLMVTKPNVAASATPTAYANDGYKQRIHHNSSGDPEAPHPPNQMSFCRARDVAMMLTLPPSNNPYYVIPRAYTDGSNKAFTLGVMTDRQVGLDLDVSCRTISPQCSLFNNYTVFPLPPELLKPCRTTVQAKIAKCAPLSAESDRLLAFCEIAEQQTTTTGARTEASSAPPLEIEDSLL